MVPQAIDVIKPPSPAIYSVPKEWKNLPKQTDSSMGDQGQASALPGGYYKTRRLCPAINDAFNFGYTMYLPHDIFINSTNEQYIDVYASANIAPQNIESSSIYSMREQKIVLDYNKNKFYHSNFIKIFMAFSVKTEPGYSCWFTSPVSNLKLPIKAIDGVIDTDTFPASRSFPFLVSKDFNGVIPAGTPILQVIPFKREDYTMHIVKDFDTQLDATNSSKLLTKFKSGYKNFFWHRKKFL